LFALLDHAIESPPHLARLTFDGGLLVRLRTEGFVERAKHLRTRSYVIRVLLVEGPQ
jgi:hypothetical protein